MACIYKITNLKNDKVYIGQTVQEWERRKWDHEYTLSRGCHKNPHLQNAYYKYGKDSFKFEIIEECSKEYLDDKECFWIDKYNALDRKVGYNIEAGGNKNKKLAEETKQKLREVNIGRWCSISEKEAEQVKLELLKDLTPKEVSEKLGISYYIVMDIRQLESYVWVRPDLNERLEKLAYRKMEILSDKERENIIDRILNLESYYSIGKDYGVTGETISSNFEEYKDKREELKQIRKKEIIDMYFNNCSNREIEEKFSLSSEAIKHITKKYSKHRKLANASKCYRLWKDGFKKYEIAEMLNINSSTITKRIKLYEEIYGKEE